MGSWSAVTSDSWRVVKWGPSTAEMSVLTVAVLLVAWRVDQMVASMVVLMVA